MPAKRKEVHLSVLTFILFAVFALGLGSFYRFPGLDRRPMHTDEAILATKFSDFWTTGEFHYDPADYHGPALHQVSWLWATIAGWSDPELWTDTQVRTIAAILGVGVLLVTLLFADVLGRFGTFIAILLTAVSPMMVFYSRYFIMEMLLVLLVALMLGSFWRYSQGGSRLWLLFGGACLGLQHATKETFVLNVAAAVCGWAAARVFVGEFTPRKGNGLMLSSGKRSTRPERPLLWVLATALIVSILSFSEGFRDWAAVKDSLLTYFSYWQRSGGSGHEKPWTYYLGLIFWHKDQVVWTQALIGGLGVIGILNSFFGEHKNAARHAFLVFLSVYTLALIGIYSVLSYKTPWSILAGFYALTLLAGIGARAIWKSLTSRPLRWTFNVLLGLGIYHLCFQTSRITGTHPDPREDYSSHASNPYAYAHPPPKLLKLVAEVRALADAQQGAFSAQVISRDHGWPLPWYWRNLPRIGYQNEVPETLSAPVLIIEAEFVEAALPKMENQGYDQGTFYGLRPSVLMMLYKKPQAAPRVSTPVPLMPPAEVVQPPQTLVQPPPAFSPTLPALPGMAPAEPAENLPASEPVPER